MVVTTVAYTSSLLVYFMVVLYISLVGLCVCEFQLASVRNNKGLFFYNVTDS